MDTAVATRGTGKRFLALEVRVIEIRELTMAYPGADTPAVDGVSFSVREGEFYTLLGPSGCGKTSVLRCIAGLERAHHGAIEIGGKVVFSDSVFVPPFRRDLGMVFQSYAVWPHLNVFENVAFPLRVRGGRFSRAELREHVREALALVGLEGYEDRNATQLSGGQQQRLSVARAIVGRPSVLLLDEPLSNLDARLRERMRGELLMLQRRLGLTTLFVTHDQAEALSMSDRIAVMDHGKIVQEGSPLDVYQEPANEFVASFIGSTNLYQADVVDGLGGGAYGIVRTEFGELQCRMARDVSGAGSSVVTIRPEDVEIMLEEESASRTGEQANTWPARVGLCLFTGTGMECYLDLGGTVVHARLSQYTELPRGESVRVHLPPDRCRAFPIHDKPLSRTGHEGLARLMFDEVE